MLICSKCHANMCVEHQEMHQTADRKVTFLTEELIQVGNILLNLLHDWKKLLKMRFQLQKSSSVHESLLKNSL